MHLLHMHSKALSVDGREMPLMDVIKHTLHFISQQALQKLKEQIGKLIPSKIRWVLTVPALWS
jgi:molecular chaperone DnaK (HSP70)